MRLLPNHGVASSASSFVLVLSPKDGARARRAIGLTCDRPLRLNIVACRSARHASERYFCGAKRRRYFGIPYLVTSMRFGWESLEFCFVKRLTAKFFCWTHRTTRAVPPPMKLAGQSSAYLEASLEAYAQGATHFIQGISASLHLCSSAALQLCSSATLQLCNSAFSIPQLLS